MPERRFRSGDSGEEQATATATTDKGERTGAPGRRSVGEHSQNDLPHVFFSGAKRSLFATGEQAGAWAGFYQQ